MIGFRIILYLVLLVAIFSPLAYLFLSVLSSDFQMVLLTDFLKDFFGSRISIVFLRTIMIGGLTAALSTLIGMLLALILECFEFWNRRIIYFVFIIPFLLPPFLTSYSWLFFVDDTTLFPEMRGELSLVFFLSMSFFPISMLLTSFGLRNISMSQIESGLIFNRKRTISRIVIPLLKPHLMISAFFIFFLSISEYTIPSFIGVNTYPNEIFVQFASFYNLNKAIVYSIPLLIFSLVSVLSLSFLFKGNPFATVSSFSKSWRTFAKMKGLLKPLSYSFVFSIIFLSIVLPFSGFLRRSEFGFLSSILLAQKEIFNSISISIIGSIVVLGVGFLASFYLRRSRNFLILTSLPLALSSPIIGISLINLYIGFPFPVYGTITILLLGYLLKLFPFTVLIFSAFFSQMSQSIVDAARIFSSNQFRIIRKIVFPLSKPAFISAFFILFILIIGEVGVTQMLSPAGFQTLSQRIETLMHYGDYKNVASLSVILSSSILLFASIYLAVFRKYAKD